MQYLVCVLVCLSVCALRVTISISSVPMTSASGRDAVTRVERHLSSWSQQRRNKEQQQGHPFWVLDSPVAPQVVKVSLGCSSSSLDLFRGALLRNSQSGDGWG